MDELKFGMFFSNAIDVVLKYILTENTKDQIINEVIHYG